ncbi:protein-export chaperone SecB [Secundilactobacillus yichangensis]|uniref:protein-export chaperone SecB n=1 Tax=Secundilactobacillus yichangensis TaxID=2799580 RepID=UPI0019417475|nr:protein-export chaperone SecB [Secundilactobacillus yichangensis]
MTILEFEGYQVDNMQYQRNKNYKVISKSEIKLNPKIQVKNSINDNHIEVTLSVSVGSIEDSNVPFDLKCTLTGFFIYHPETDTDNIGPDTLVRNNAVAILYPYIRMVVSTLTMTSNEYPSYIMPTVNVGEVIAKQNGNNK